MTSEDVGGFSASQDGAEPISIGDATPEPTIEAPADTDGQAETEGVVEAPAFNVDEYGSHLATVTVNGEEQQVTMAEALAGYQRQSAFTQGMQEVSSARALQTALENPATRAQALQLMNDQYGAAAATQAAEASASEGADDYQDQSPVERQLAELREWKLGIELDETMARLQSKYGDSFVPDDVYNAALASGTQDIAGLEQVFQTMKFEEMFAKATATDQVAQAQAAETQSRQAAAQAAAQAVSSGNGVSAGSAASTPIKYTTFEAAAEAAWASDAPFKL